MSLLEQAIERFNVRDYVAGHGHGILFEMPNGEIVTVCPLCGKEKLCVNPRKRTWHCWVCETYSLPDQFGRRHAVRGAGGLVSLIAMFEGLDNKKAAERVISVAAFRAEELAQVAEGELKRDFLEVYSEARAINAPDFFQPISGILPYMVKRGISLEDARMFGLGWCSHGRYANRLIFPVWEDGRFVYFQARAMWEEHERPGERYIKALNPGREDGAAVSSDVLMNLDQARHYPRVCIVEGPKDCVSAGPSGVCTFGKKISPTQIAKLLRAGVRAVDLMWDGPSEREPHGAWPEMFATAPLLASLFDLRLVFLPSGDPGERTRVELDWRRDNAQPYNGVSRLAVV